MPLGTEFNLGPGDVVLDGVQLLKGAQPPGFGSCLLWPHGWMDEDTTWYGSRPLPRPRCIGRGPSSPRKGHSSLPLFSAHVYYGHGRPSTAELLFTCCISALPEFSQLLFDFFNILTHDSYISAAVRLPKYCNKCVQLEAFGVHGSGEKSRALQQLDCVALTKHQCAVFWICSLAR